MNQSPIRFTGLFSGMDTQSMVQQLMRAESMRMDRLTRRRQTIAWRQEDLRNTMGVLGAFQSVNTDLIRAGSITNPATWNTMRSVVSRVGGANAGEVSPPGITVHTSPTARTGYFDITVRQVAQGDVVRGNQFWGTSVNANNPAYQRIEPFHNVSTLLGGNFTAPGTFLRHEHLTDGDGRGRYDISSLTFASTLPGDFLGEVHIQKGPGGIIEQLVDAAGRVFNREDIGGGDYELRYENAGGTDYIINTADLEMLELVTQHTGDLYAEDFGPNGPDLRVTERIVAPSSATVMINGQNFEITGQTLIGEFMRMVNTREGLGARISFDEQRGTFLLESTRMGENAVVFTGDDSFGLLRHLGLDNIRGGSADGSIPGDDVDLVRTTPGFMRQAQNARITIFDNLGAPIDFVSGNNEFTETMTGLWGIRININQAAAPRVDSDGNTIYNTFRIDTRPNVDETLEAIRTFINNFNDLLRALNALHSTPRPRANNGNFFDPLTDLERQEMSDREIERWEEQARVGLLHRNDSIRNLHMDLRRVLHDDVVIGPPGNQTRINITEFFAIGGTQTTSREDRAIGVIDLDWDRLRQALYDEPDRVQALFSRSILDAEQDHGTGAFTGIWSRQRNDTRAPFIGLGQRIHDAIDNAIHSGGGTIHRIAGAAGYWNDTINPMSMQIRSYDQRLEQMQRWLIRRENHFFGMFARMEQVMANANAQMDALWMMGGM